MKRTAVINIVGLTNAVINQQTPAILKYQKNCHTHVIKPVFPAVTCSAQSTYLTGSNPSQHGIVGNGWYDREYSEIRFWKQSNHLVGKPKLWENIRKIHPDYKCAKLFWWYNMYSTADYSITPRPLYPADGRKIFDIHTHPLDLREKIKASIGEFPFPYFWGPLAGIKSSQWIATAAQWIEQAFQPDLNLIYLPHLDYNFQRFSPNHPESIQSLSEIDQIVDGLLSFFQERNIQVVLLSEYGITEVDQPIPINQILRKNHWIKIKNELGREHIDYGSSPAFAIADHQMAHIYINDPTQLKNIQKTLEKTPGIAQVLDQQGKKSLHIDHPRAGDLVALAQPRAWFHYYYWLDQTKAPDYAKCVDIHRKPGYDPAELFFDPDISFLKPKIISKLIRKKLGFRTLMDVIPINPNLVRGSHGIIPPEQTDWPILIGPPKEKNHFPPLISATDVYHKLWQYIDP